MTKKAKKKPAAAGEKKLQPAAPRDEPRSLQLDLSVLRINNAFMVYLPGESMVEFQLFAQSVKPDDFVAVAAYGDLGTGYVCTEKAFDEGGYEPSASKRGS